MVEIFDLRSDVYNFLHSPQMFNRSAKCCSLKLNFDGSGINSSLFQNTKRFASKSLFIDEKVISVSSGRGGDGKIAFAKDKWHQFGPASGGNGGIGASIYLVASKRITTLNGLNSKYLGVNGKVATFNSRKEILESCTVPMQKM